MKMNTFTMLGMMTSSSYARVRTPTLTLIHTLRNEGEKCVMSL